MNSGTNKERFWAIIFFLSIIPFLIFASSQSQTNKAVFPKTETIEKELLALINMERKLNNLPLLELSSTLSDMARLHSLDMDILLPTEHKQAGETEMPLSII